MFKPKNDWFVIEDQNEPTLEQAQDFVGGFVELINLKEKQFLVKFLVNEDDLLEGLPFNAKASALAGIPLVGPVLVLTGKARWR